MTNQEAFDRMCEHLMTQGCRAEDDDGDCRYRTDDGKMCPVGVLIPDDQYHPDIEDNWAPALCDIANDVFVPALKGLNPRMLDDVQGVHDRIAIVDWPRSLRVVAKDYALAVPACIQVASTATPNHTSTEKGLTNTA